MSYDRLVCHHKCDRLRQQGGVYISILLLIRTFEIYGFHVHHLHPYRWYRFWRDYSGWVRVKWGRWWWWEEIDYLSERGCRGDVIRLLPNPLFTVRDNCFWAGECVRWVHLHRRLTYGWWWVRMISVRGLPIDSVHHTRVRWCFLSDQRLIHSRYRVRWDVRGV